VLKPSLQERVRQKFQDLTEKGDVSHETLGTHLGLSRSGVSRLLNDDDNGFALQHIERLCEFFQITPAEIMAEPGAQIVPVSPIEAALLAHVRQMTELERRSLLTLLDRHLTITTPRRAGLGRAALNSREQELVDLFARSNDGAREGVLKVLRESARQKVKETTG